jgi:hypothetical protein
MTTKGDRNTMNIGHLRNRKRNALALVLTLALGGFAQAAHADAGGCELLGFPSEDGAVVEAPACAVAPQPPMPQLLAASEPAPKPAPAPRPRRVIYAVPATPVAPAAPADGRVLRNTVRTDTTIAVKPGMRLVLNNYGGSIGIRTWSRNAVRVRADHGRRDWVEFGQVNKELRVTSVSRLGLARSVEYDLTVPAWLPVALSGVYNDVNVDGLQGGIEVETVRGDIVVRHAAGVIALRSVEGVVDLMNSKGKIDVSSVNDAVRVADVAGTIAAEAVNGDIHLIDVDSRDVEATTVNGEVVYDGLILDGGNYRFATHNGDIALGLAESANATVGVSTFSGDFESAFAIQPRKAPKGHRFTFALGNGSAKIDLESFQGSIELMKPGGRVLRARITEAWKEHEREKVKEWKWEMKGAKNGDSEDDEDGDN